MNDISKYLGPGYWASMHIEAYAAETYEDKIAASKTIARLISSFPCEKCRDHGVEYASMHPFIDAINDSDPLSLFKWVWRFHNHVNHRLGKDKVSLENAIGKWGDQAICKQLACID